MCDCKYYTKKMLYHKNNHKESSNYYTEDTFEKDFKSFQMCTYLHRINNFIIYILIRK